MERVIVPLALERLHLEYLAQLWAGPEHGPVHSALVSPAGARHRLYRFRELYQPTALQFFGSWFQKQCGVILDNAQGHILQWFQTRNGICSPSCEMVSVGSAFTGWSSCRIISEIPSRAALVLYRLCPGFPLCCWWLSPCSHHWLHSVPPPYPSTTGRMLLGPSGYSRRRKLSLGMRSTPDRAFLKFSSTRWCGRFGANIDYSVSVGGMLREDTDVKCISIFKNIFHSFKIKTGVWRRERKVGYVLSFLCSSSAHLKLSFLFS